MDGLQWKTLLKWMIWGYHYFRKHPYEDVPTIQAFLPTTHRAFVPIPFSISRRMAAKPPIFGGISAPDKWRKHQRPLGPKRVATSQRLPRDPYWRRRFTLPLGVAFCVFVCFYVQVVVSYISMKNDPWVRITFSLSIPCQVEFFCFASNLIPKRTYNEFPKELTVFFRR